LRGNIEMKSRVIKISLEQIHTKADKKIGK
jgi:hypothetical protein